MNTNEMLRTLLKVAQKQQAVLKKLAQAVAPATPVAPAAPVATSGYDLAKPVADGLIAKFPDMDIEGQFVISGSGTARVVLQGTYSVRTSSPEAIKAAAYELLKLQPCCAHATTIEVKLTSGSANRPA
jgi:hypothetical protein